MRVQCRYRTRVGKSRGCGKTLNGNTFFTYLSYLRAVSTCAPDQPRCPMTAPRQGLARKICGPQAEILSGTPSPLGPSLLVAGGQIFLIREPLNRYACSQGEREFAAAEVICNA